MEKQEEIKKSEDINIHQEKIHSVVFSKEIGWQEIIYDLINSEQLDPWNVDITVLTNKYLEKIQELEENYFVSSKVLLAAALLLRIKSEILLNKYIKTIDEILFGSREKKQTIMERIELDEEIPELIPKSPLPRFRKVTINELVESLNKAIITENRRIRKEVLNNRALIDASFSLPKRKFAINDRIKEIYERLFECLKNNGEGFVPFSVLVGNEKDGKIYTFTSLLHLENQKKIWLHQEEHFGDINVWYKETFFERNQNHFDDLKNGEEEIIEEKEIDESEK
ncbi:segregation/condensation protein A [Candidatus Pacearchaeota archaeon]|nr:segregation/condensation protein A [Candidatus Pacearchaeota archaeon]